MHRRKLFIAGVVVALVAALTVGLTVARSQDGATLPTLAPAELLAKVAQEAPKTTAVSGDVAWINDLLGSAPALLPVGDSGLAGLLQTGAGRFWYQEGKLRFESQGSRGDVVAVLNGGTAWVYDSKSGTATEYTLPAKPAGSADAETSSDAGAAAAPLDLPQKIQEMVDRLAPDATLAVSTATVAGRSAYVLTMTPTATNTVFGSVRAAFDGTTFLPLRVQVFAKDATTAPVLEAGFTKVSYDEIPAGTFEFTPPVDAKVEHSTLTMAAGMLGGMMGAGGHRYATGDDGSAVGPPKEAELTLDEAAARAGFAPVVPSDPALTFKGAAVIDPSILGGSMMGALSGGVTGDSPTPGEASEAPLVMLRYGEGFGTVMVIETQVTDAQWAQATTALSQVPMFGTPSAFGGHQVYQLSTKLGSLVAWRQGDVVVLMGGSVSQGALEAFAASIHE
ncbi:MAG: LolA family protein [Thermoleophilia bacterium]